MATKGEKSEGMPTEKTKASCSGGVIASDCSACTDDFEMCVEQPQVDFNMEKLLSRVRRLDMEESFPCYVTAYYLILLCILNYFCITKCPAWLGL